MERNTKFNPQWLKTDVFRSTIYTVTSVFSLGLLTLYCYYVPLFGLKLTCSPCDPEECDFVILEVDGKLVGNSVQHCDNSNLHEHLVVVEIDSVRYVASNQDKYLFAKLPEMPKNFKRFLRAEYTQVNNKVLLHEEYKLLNAQYGPNIMTIPDSNFLEIAFKKMLSPFFLFQYFSATVWFCESYNLYAILILLFTFVTIYMTASEELFNLQRLKKLAGIESTVRMVERNRNGNEAQIEVGLSSIVPASVLIPGDRFIVTEGMILPCDAVLVHGRVIVDESMLTGESVPVSKVPIDTFGLGSDIDTVMTSGKIHTSSPRNSSLSLLTNVTAEEEGEIDIIMKRSGSVLFGGTKVKAVYGEECIAVVCRTGFRSAKGQLVASLLKGKEGLMTFVADALWIIFMILIFTTVIYSFMAYELYEKGANLSDLILLYLDAVTTSVPALLTASLTVATAVSIDRLKLRDIYVTDTTRVNYAGMVNAVCFDKTGTLTKTSLNFVGASLVEEEKGSSAETKTLVFKEYMTDGHHPLPLIVLELMATCHSLSLAGYNGDEPAGDPLEVELVSATGWTLRQSGDGSGKITAFAHSRKGQPQEDAATMPFDYSNKYDLLKHFEFTPDKLRAATLLKRPNGSLVYLMKGSPEMIVKLCEGSGTVPDHIHKTLIDIARKGLRVIAMAYRECLPAAASAAAVNDMLRQTQDQIENNSSGAQLKFIGLLFLSNSLKDETVATIRSLHTARVHMNMITGDHIFTAIAVANQCGIFNQNAISSSTSNNDSPQKTSAVDTIYIVDESEADGNTVIINSATNQVVTDMTLNSLLIQVASSYHAQNSLSSAIKAEECVDGDCQNNSYFPALHAFTNALTDSSAGYSNIDDEADAPLLGSNKDRNTAQTNSCIQIAVTGKGLASVVRNYSECTLKHLVRYARVFARTKPHDKKFIVERLMSTTEYESLDELVLTDTIANKVTTASPGAVRYNTLANRRIPENGGAVDEFAEEEARISKETKHKVDNFEVLFCGDGANDMTALKAASVGVSLCDAETSVAAPVTSRRETPGSVIDVLKEGRCSLITAYVLIVFNVLYGAAQLLWYCVVYYYGIFPGHYTCLEEDVFFALILGIVVSLTPPADNLSVVLPPRRFLSVFFVSKLIIILITFIIFQIIAQWVLTRQDFYVPFTTDAVLTTSYAYENTVAQDMTIIQLMIASVVCTMGHPFRKAWYTNTTHVIVLSIQSVMLTWQVLVQDSSFMINVMDIEPLPLYFGGILLTLMAIHVVVCVSLSYLLDRHFFSQLKTERFDKMKEVTQFSNRANTVLQTLKLQQEKQKELAQRQWPVTPIGGGLKVVTPSTTNGKSPRAPRVVSFAPNQASSSVSGTIVTSPMTAGSDSQDDYDFDNEEGDYQGGHSQKKLSELMGIL